MQYLGWRRTSALSRSGAFLALIATQIFFFMGSISCAAEAQPLRWDTYFQANLKELDAKTVHIEGPHQLVPGALELSDRSALNIEASGDPINSLGVALRLPDHVAARTVVQFGFQFSGNSEGASVAAQLELQPDGTGQARLIVTANSQGQSLRSVALKGNPSGLWTLEMRYGHARLLVADNPVLETVIYSGESGPRTTVIGCLHGRVQISSVFLRKVATVRKPPTALLQQNVESASEFAATADAARLQGDIASAIANEERAFELYKQNLGSSSFSAGAAEANLGGFLSEAGQVARARASLEAAVASLRVVAGSEHPQTAAAELALANVLTVARDVASAMPLAEHALAVVQRVYDADDPAVAGALSTYAEIASELGNNVEAIQALRRAVKIRTQTFGANNIHVAPYLQQLAELELSTKQIPEAVADLKVVKSIYVSQGQKFDGSVRATRNLAIAYGRQGKADLMRSTLQEALSEALTVFPAGDYRLGLLEADLATLELLVGRRNAAIEHARKALRIQLQVTEATVLALSEHEAVLAVKSLDARRDLFASTVLDNSNSVSRGDYALLSAAKSLVSQISLARLEAAGQGNHDQNSKLRQQLSNVHSFLTGAALYNGAMVRDPRVDTLVEILTKEQERLEREIYSGSQDIAEHIGSESYLNELLARRKEEAGAIIVDSLLSHTIDTAASSLSSVKYEARYDLFVVGPSDTGKVTHIAIGSGAEVDGAVGQWLSAIGSRVYGLGGASPVSTKSGAQVRDLIWRPIQKEYPGASRIYLLPDGVLSRLPWSALPTDDGNHYLVETGLKFRTALTLASLLTSNTSTSRAGNPKIVLIGNIDYNNRIDPVTGRLESRSSARLGMKWPSLPGTKGEISGLANLVRSSRGDSAIQVLSGAYATEDAVEKALPGANIIHFATHGYFADDAVAGEPERSSPDDNDWSSYAEDIANRSIRSPATRNGLVLAGANLDSRIDGKRFRIEKGIITAQELTDLNLRGVDLVVLSACDSGLGKDEAGEGVFGLQRSLLLAGVKGVLASLWKVDDTATSRFMMQYYSAMFESRMTPDDALWSVQRSWIRNGYPMQSELRGPGIKTSVDAAKVKNAVLKAPKKREVLPADWAAFEMAVN